MSYRPNGTPCVFCDILDGLSPAVQVQETGTSITIVPLTPVVPGHVLFIPRRHVEDASTDPWLTGQVMMDASAYAARAGGEFNLVTSAGRAATQSVFHLHIHYVPRSTSDQLMLPWGTVYGEDPTLPHHCAGMSKLQTRLMDVSLAYGDLRAKSTKD